MEALQRQLDAATAEVEEEVLGLAASSMLQLLK